MYESFNKVNAYIQKRNSEDSLEMENYNNKILSIVNWFSEKEQKDRLIELRKISNKCLNSNIPELYEFIRNVSSTGKEGSLSFHIQLSSIKPCSFITSLTKHLGNKISHLGGDLEINMIPYNGVGDSGIGSFSYKYDFCKPDTVEKVKFKYEAIKDLKEEFNILYKKVTDFIESLGE